MILILLQKKHIKFNLYALIDNVSTIILLMLILLQLELKFFSVIFYF